MGERRVGGGDGGKSNTREVPDIPEGRNTTGGGRDVCQSEEPQ